MGYEFLAVRTEVLDVNPLYGQLTFSGTYSKPSAALTNCATTTANCTNAYDLADFYFGLPSAIGQGTRLRDQCPATPQLHVRPGRLAR